MPRETVANALAGIVLLEGIHVPRAESVQKLLARYGSGADLGDMIHLASAAKLDGFATFDRRLARDAGPDSPLPIETLA